VISGHRKDLCKYSARNRNKIGVTLQVHNFKKIQPQTGQPQQITGKWGTQVAMTTSRRGSKTGERGGERGRREEIR